MGRVYSVSTMFVLITHARALSWAPGLPDGIHDGEHEGEEGEGVEAKVGAPVVAASSLIVAVVGGGEEDDAAARARR